MFYPDVSGDVNESLAMENATEVIHHTVKVVPLYIVVPVTTVYALIFVCGVVGNVSTCIVITRNRHMHTATNYYLFSLAVSDLLLLVSGLPQEMVALWSRSYIFGEPYCVMTGIVAETCANATVLTITAFTVERYVAICYPFLSHTVTKLSRAVKFVLGIWLLALCLALPQAIQFGLRHDTVEDNGTVVGEITQCTLRMSDSMLQHTFEVSTILFFVTPMTVITALYLLIGFKLRRTRLVKRPSLTGVQERNQARSQNHVIRMLVAVVVAFFICWAPFHAQRLLAIYANYIEVKSQTLVDVYIALTYISGILYYLSTAINPILYNIMSHKFREAFKHHVKAACGSASSINDLIRSEEGSSYRSKQCTPYQLCRRQSRVSVPARSYSIISRGGNTRLVTEGVELEAARETGPNNTQLNQVGRLSRLRFAPEPLIQANTISNSSLQDIDEPEYTGTELAHYMGQLNTR